MSFRHSIRSWLYQQFTGGAIFFISLDVFAIWRYYLGHMAGTKTKEEARQVVALLGGDRVFPEKIKNVMDLQEVLRVGLPYAAYEAILDALGLSSLALSQIVGIASRTLARRKASKFLSPIESDRLYRVARTTLQASDVLGSLEKAREWLHQTNQALGGVSPVSQLDTEIGERQVEDLLNRINHGIFS